MAGRRRSGFSGVVTTTLLAVILLPGEYRLINAWLLETLAAQVTDLNNQKSKMLITI